MEECWYAVLAADNDEVEDQVNMQQIVMSVRSIMVEVKHNCW